MSSFKRGVDSGNNAQWFLTCAPVRTRLLAVHHQSAKPEAKQFLQILPDAFVMGNECPMGLFLV